MQSYNMYAVKIFVLEKHYLFDCQSGLPVRILNLEIGRVCMFFNMKMKKYFRDCQDIAGYSSRYA